ncbi:MAG: DNA mismatch repair protein MutS, partial [Candidatus Marinimicrobia bacterium]|nr:DNA mismatch repair protein MutS [Candidatus Neomarinimicrobiota bacterium]
STLTLMPEICAAVSESSSKALQSFVENIPDTEEIVAKINSTLKDDVPALLNKGGVIRDGVDSELDELRSIASGGKEWIAAMQDSERKATGISSLKVGYNKVFGYYLSVTKTHIDKVPEHYIRKQTLVNAERYITPELKEYEEKILTSEEKILAIEIRIFDELRKWILSRAQLILQSASLLNKIDLHSTLAEVAVRNSYVKPTITDEPRMVLKDSRHPVVEAILPAGEEFVRNDLEVDNSKSQILLITGPNMAGKSTYLRQIGLVTVMAQMGSFVPTREAEIGIVDRLFTRVGASDNLAGGESTFLVEMIEAANILNNATPKSLIIFDEIGRGTATFDGLSLAWAITEFVHNTEFAQARTLFATHYHELTELEELLERVVNYNVAVKEFGDKIVFLRKIIPGPSDKSYGIHVAKMAGLPGAVINRATEILSHLIRHEAPEIDGTEPPQDASKQITLFQEEESKLRKKLAELEINDMTPLEALEELDRLKSEYGL